MTLPEIPGVRILAEIRADRFCRWLRVDAAQSELLVVFHDAQAGGVALLEAVTAAAAAPGFASVRASGQHHGLPWFRLAADTGEDPLRIQPLGELVGLELLRKTAAALHAAPLGEGHGGLLQGGLTLLSGPAVQIVPSFLVEDWLAEQVDAPVRADVPRGYRALGASARDLSALAVLGSHWIAGVRPVAAAGLAALPPKLTAAASPATVAVIRTLLKAAGEEPSRADAKILFGRIAQIRPDAGAKRPSPRPAPLSRPEEVPERDLLQPRERPGRPAVRRIPALIGSLLVAALLFAVVAMGGGGAIREFVAGVREREQETLPTPTDPMAAASGPAAPNRPAEEPGAEDPDAKAAREAEAAQIADRVIQQLIDKRAKPVAPAKPSIDKTTIAEGGRLKEQAVEILRAVRDHEVKHEDRNRRLDEAIDLLEKARENYMKFIEQYPDKESLVEGTLQDVIALQRMAVKSKTRS